MSLPTTIFEHSLDLLYSRSLITVQMVNRLDENVSATFLEKLNLYLLSLPQSERSNYTNVIEACHNILDRLSKAKAVVVLRHLRQGLNSWLTTLGKISEPEMTIVSFTIYVLKNWWLKSG